MYNIGDYFKIDLNKAIANPDCVFLGEKYRITILTERLIRLEYSENGIFNDMPSELVLYRNFNKPQFTVSDKDKMLKIATKYFELSYVKGKSFIGSKLSPSSNLKISLLGTNRSWYYKHPEAKNFKYSTKKSINDKDIEEEKSLYSLDGFASIDDSNSLLLQENGTFTKRNSKEIDIYVFMYNNDFYSCLQDYFMITGYPLLIPRYALGNWWNKEDSYNEFDIAHIIKKFEENNVPISLFTLNNWNDNNYSFKEIYKYPKSIINYLNNKNIKLGLSIDSISDFSTKDVDKIKEYVTPDKKGNIPFNLYDSRVLDSYLKILVHPIDNLGINYYFVKGDNKLLKHYLYYDQMRNTNKRPLLVGEPNIANHRYSCTYAGKSSVSFDALKNIPKFNNSSSNMGISYYYHDFGGNSGGIEDNELFTRFVQLGVFSPILSLGSDGGKYYKREPWKWGFKTASIVTSYLNLRYRLIPYIYTECYNYYKTGKPLLEPIYYSYPSMYDYSEYNSEYFFGRQFLISPITNKKDYVMNRVIQKLFIPEGIWYDFFTGKKFTGNKRYVSFYKDEEFPVFVKAGSIIPVSLNRFNDTSSPKKMELQVFPGSNGSYNIYEDDGETNNYKNGEYLITNIEYLYEKNNYKLTILPTEGKEGIIPGIRDYKIRFKNTSNVSKIISYVGNSQVTNNNYSLGNDYIVEVSNVPTKEQLTIICSGEDIEIDALRIVNDDIISIISDLPLTTKVKQHIDDVMFSKETTFKKKRIEIRRLSNYGVEKKYIDLFLKLLEYINEV